MVTASSRSRTIRPTTRRHRKQRDVRFRTETRSERAVFTIQAIRTGTLLPSISLHLPLARIVFISPSLRLRSLQLGVLAWCAEFSEMIDAIKQLGVEGNMFVSTRQQALRTCEEILQLPLDVQMQIIVIHLITQVQRLRRFLDVDKVWDDYPTITFPMDYENYDRQQQQQGSPRGR